jgi:carbon storage regulator
VINNDIEIVVVEIRGDKVRLGIKAPRQVPVHRKEVQEAILRTMEFAPGSKVSCTRKNQSLDGIVKANTNGNLLIEWVNGVTQSYTSTQAKSSGINVYGETA